MININTVYESVQQICNKSQNSGYTTPAEFNLYANMASQSLFNTLFSEFQRLEKITDLLRFFITKKSVSIDENGKMLFPDSYRYLLALRTYDKSKLDLIMDGCEDGIIPNYNKLPQVGVQLIDNDKLWYRLESEILHPSYTNPIATIYSSYIQFYPVDLGTAIIDFLAEPITAEWKYTTDSYGLAVYDPITSIDYNWSPVAQNQLIMLICRYIGIEIRDEELVSVTNQIQKEGT